MFVPQSKINTTMKINDKVVIYDIFKAKNSMATYKLIAIDHIESIEAYVLELVEPVDDWVSKMKMTKMLFNALKKRGMIDQICN